MPEVRMIGSKPNPGKAAVHGRKSRWVERGVLGAVCALVIGLYAYVAQSGCLEVFSLRPADTYYNLLVQGFRAGQLSLKKEVPPAITLLANPYALPVNLLDQSELYGMLDMSYYKGRLYLYFGVTPALILFWPFVALTGHYLLHRQAVVIFCAIGFLASVGLVHAVWRRYFAEVSVMVVAACVLALGLATGVPVLLARCDIYEVVISCGYMLTMLALGAIWRALHEPERRTWWLAAASLAYGLALGARPSLLFGAVILLLPVAQARRERRKVSPPLMAAIGPIVLIGLGLMLYNFLRFDNPLEFGQRVQLNGAQQLERQFFSARYFWFNFRIYFLAPARWMSHWPLVREIAMPTLPAGYVRTEDPFGILPNIPLVWLALAVPLAWRRRSTEEGTILRWFVIAGAMLFGTCALTMLLFSAGCARYEVEFLPALMLLAVMGILSLERSLALSSKSWQTGRQVWRRVARWGWSLLLGFSVAFNLLASVEHYARTDKDLGLVLWQIGKLSDAIRQCEHALWLWPDYAEAHNNLGIVLEQVGKTNDAIRHYERALQIKPGLADAHYNLGTALARLGRVREAAGHWEEALRIKPGLAEGHKSLGAALVGLGRTQEAVGHLEQAVRIKPDDAEAHYSLGVALAQLGRVSEAVGHWEQALRIKPDYAVVHGNLGVALERAGRIQEAIEHYEEALRLDPDYADAHYNLGIALERAGRVREAIAHYEQAVRIKPDYAEAHNNLGTALARLGRVPEAIGHWEQALRINPNYARAHYNLGVALEESGRASEAMGQYEQALRINPNMAEAQNGLARLRTVQ